MTTDHPTAKVARDLGIIIALAADLPEQAEHQANSRVIMGGDALANTAPVANLEAWGHRQDAAEQAYVDGRRVSWPSTEHEDYTDEPVLQTLLFWSENTRRQYDQELGDRTATIHTEASFLRWVTEAMWRSEERWDDYAADVSRARRKLENVLRAGKRDEATRVRCNNPFCESKPVLRRIVTEDGRQDWYKCRACRKRYDEQGLAAAHAEQVKGAGDWWAPRREMELVLGEFGTPDSVVQAWIKGEGLDGAMLDHVAMCCDLETRRELVQWWPLWKRHEMRAKRLQREKDARTKRGA